MANKGEATQAAVDAVKVATQVINDYGRESTEASGATSSACDAVNTALLAGATPDELRDGGR
ncbi:hypothetical protein TPA0598_17_00120 [Streptomyces lydicamycinicus]|uniref:Uncharacterized protein n=1 Tax=Streptomyces lydicamycinicus TaxID=1546107 RepID=A0A0P4RIY5_9ACTN|nr:hypothetical protein [Streptomyces lydicamycinicus]GAO13031.1 hypothetical protein TPA0598_17_00120 [Streptomyces lydicamycinicus]